MIHSSDYSFSVATHDTSRKAVAILHGLADCNYRQNQLQHNLLELTKDDTKNAEMHTPNQFNESIAMQAVRLGDAPLLEAMIYYDSLRHLINLEHRNSYGENLFEMAKRYESKSAEHANVYQIVSQHCGFVDVRNAQRTNLAKVIDRRDLMRWIGRFGVNAVDSDGDSLMIKLFKKRRTRRLPEILDKHWPSIKFNKMYNGKTLMQVATEEMPQTEALKHLRAAAQRQKAHCKADGEAS
jgi:hypothetical protein